VFGTSDVGGLVLGTGGDQVFVDPAESDLAGDAGVESLKEI
jgi:hypothetical protein